MNDMRCARELDRSTVATLFLAVVVGFSAGACAVPVETGEGVTDDWESLGDEAAESGEDPGEDVAESEQALGANVLEVFDQHNECVEAGKCPTSKTY